MQRKYRLYWHQPLSENATLKLPTEQSHYIMNVLRLKSGNFIYLFNPESGEWQTEITVSAKKSLTVTCRHQTRLPIITSPYPKLYFAPIKRQRMELLIEKSVELGVAHLRNIITQHSQAPLLKNHRVQKILEEATEQSERLDLPQFSPALKFDEFYAQLNDAHPAICFLETGDAVSAPDWFQEQAQKPAPTREIIKNAPLLIGPEGGFSPNEIAALQRHPAITTLSLGTRILRSETAAMVALTLWQSFFGDFRQPRPKQQN